MCVRGEFGHAPILCPLAGPEREAPSLPKEPNQPLRSVTAVSASTMPAPQMVFSSAVPMQVAV